jgi:hypothetical protein
MTDTAFTTEELDARPNTRRLLVDVIGERSNF